MWPLSRSVPPEREETEEADQPERGADLGRAYAVDVERLDLRDDVGALAELVLCRLLVAQVHDATLHAGRGTKHGRSRLLTHSVFVTEETRTPQQSTSSSGLDRFFRISERGSTMGREVRGGLVTFLTMAYIIVLNPLILGFVPDSTGAFLGGGAEPGSGIPAIAAGTALVAGLLTILMGGLANFPLALATGLGLNAFVAYTIARQSTWGDAMGLVVLEGIVILLLVLTGFRKAVFHAVPQQLKVAISVGIGLFIALIGFVDAGVVTRIPDAFQTTVPVQLGIGRPPRRLAGAGLLPRVDADDRAVGAPGPRRHPHLDRGHHGRGRRRRGDRPTSVSPRRTTPPAGR